MDAMGRELIEQVEGEEDDEEPAAFVDELGTWKRKCSPCPVLTAA
jgi:hypothetical protein